MNKIVKVILCLSVVLFNSVSFAADSSGKEQTLYHTGAQKTFVGPEQYFTGKVFVEMLFPQNKDTAFSGAYVSFQPGARTAWHLHPAGQHMIVTNGTCLTGTRDGKVIAFKKGETVWCPPDIDHWHGATPDHAVTHLVITGSKDGQNVIWKEKVTDEQYLSAVTKTEKGNKMDVDKYLDKKQQAIIPVSAFAASGDLEKLAQSLNAALDAGLTVNEVKEVLVQVYPYCGFPRSLNALGTFMAVVNERKTKGVNDPAGKDATALPNDFNSLDVGTQVQTELVGQPVKGALFDFVPVINTYLQSHLFGDIFTRDVLDHKTRELVTVSILSNINGAEPQLKAHVNMAQNAGLTKDQLKAIFEVLENKVGIVKPNIVE